MEPEDQFKMIIIFSDCAQIVLVESCICKISKLINI